MPIMYNNQNVDASYSDKLEANLYYGSVLVPGVTCDDGYLEGPGGGVYIHRLSTDGGIDPTTPGGDFTDEETEDTLIQVTLNNCFRRSRKLYNVQAAAVGADLKDGNLAEAQAEVREGWCVSGLACLMNEGSISADTTAATADNCIQLVIDARKEIVTDKGRADVVLCSPAFYALVLKSAGKEFLPALNDRIRGTGAVGTYLGMTWVESNALTDTAAKYYDYSGALKTVDLSEVDFAVYQHDTLSVITNVNMARLVDSELFNGCKAQVEQNTGYRVREPKLVRIHKKA